MLIHIKKQRNGCYKTSLKTVRQNVNSVVLKSAPYNPKLKNSEGATVKECLESFIKKNDEHLDEQQFELKEVIRQQEINGQSCNMVCQVGCQLICQGQQELLIHECDKELELEG